MGITYSILLQVLVVVIGFIIFLIYKNRKDKRKYEKEIIDSEIKPEKHGSDKI